MTKNDGMICLGANVAILAYIFSQNYFYELATDSYETFSYEKIVKA